MPNFEKYPDDYTMVVSYTTLSEKFTNKTVRSFIREKTPEVTYAEDGLPVLPQTETEGLSDALISLQRQIPRPEELKTLIEHRDDILKQAVNDRITITGKPDQKLLDDYLKLKTPDYTPLTQEERASREQFSEEFRRKYAEYSAKREMTVLMANANGLTDRTATCLLKIDISDEGIAWNKQLVDDLTSKDPAVMKAAYGRALKHIADETDMSRLDLTNDNFIKDNLDSYYNLLSSGSEIQSLINNYQALGGPNDPEVENRFEKLFAIYDAAPMLRARSDIFASSIHSTIRTEQLYTDPTYSTQGPPDANGREITPESALYPGQEADQFYTNSMRAINTVKDLSMISTFMDKSKTPAQRLESSADIYKGMADGERKKAERRVAEEKRKAEAARQKKEAREADIKKYVNADRIPAGLTPAQLEKRMDYEIRLRKNIESLQKLITESREKNAPLLEKQEQDIVTKYTADVLDADARLTGEEREKALRRLSAEKDNALERLAGDKRSKLVKDINITEDQIQAYLTPERMALVERSRAIQKSQNERKKLAGTFKDVPGNFIRSLYATLKHPSDPQAQAHNAYIEGFIGNPDYRSQIKRRQMIVDDVDAIRLLDSNKMSLDKPFTELADYVLDHIDACEIGFEFQATHRDMTKSVGFSEKEEFQDYMKNVVDKGVVLGGRGRLIKEMMLNDSYMKVPFEQLDGPQMELLVGAAMSSPEEYGLNDPEQVRIFGQFAVYASSKEDPQKFTEPQKGDVIDRTSFVDHRPDLNELSRQLDSFEKQLNDTDHWYNRRSSSDEYREMREALNGLKDELNKLTTKDGSAQRMDDAEQRLVAATTSYRNHVGAAPKNENQRLRDQAAAGLYTLVTMHFPAKIVKGMLNSNALAAPEEKAYFDKATTAEVKQKASADLQQKLDVEAKISSDLVKKGAGKGNAAEKEVYGMMLTARRELGNELKKPQFDSETVKPLLAAAITCQMYRKKLEGGDGKLPDPDMTVEHNNAKVKFTDMKRGDAKQYLGSEAMKLMTSDSFKNSTQNLDAEKLHNFLMSEDPTKTDIVREICGGMASRKEASGSSSLTSSVRNKSQEIEAPSKGTKSLGK